MTSFYRIYRAITDSFYNYGYDFVDKTMSEMEKYPSLFSEEEKEIVVRYKKLLNKYSDISSYTYNLSDAILYPINNRLFLFCQAILFEYVDEEVAELSFLRYPYLSGNVETINSAKEVMKCNTEKNYCVKFISRRSGKDNYNIFSANNAIDSFVQNETATFEKVNKKTEFVLEEDNVSHYYEFSDKFIIGFHNGKITYFILSSFRNGDFDSMMKFNKTVSDVLEDKKDILFPFSTDIDLEELFDESVYSDEIKELKENIINSNKKSCLIKFSELDSFENKLKEKFINYMNSVNAYNTIISEYNKEIKELKNKIKILSKEQTDFESEKTLKVLNIYKRMKIIDQYEIIEYDGGLMININLNPIPIVYYDEQSALSYMNGVDNTILRLKNGLEEQCRYVEESNVDFDDIPRGIKNNIAEYINNIYFHKLNKKYVQDALDGKVQMYMTPMRITIYLRDNEIDFRTTNDYSAGYCNFNQHALYSGGHGCRGTFSEHFNRLSKEYNVSEYIQYVMQYIQSVNPIDPVGKYSFENAYIVDENGTILLTKYLPDNPDTLRLVGHNIFEVFSRGAESLGEALEQGPKAKGFVPIRSRDLDPRFSNSRTQYENFKDYEINFYENNEAVTSSSTIVEFIESANMEEAFNGN